MVAEALRTADAARQSARHTKPNPGTPTPRITPSVRPDCGLSAGAIQRLADCYGWIGAAKG